ncbi:MAG TPA: twin-arginine translocation signal domain-containing protein [Pyrinomonadaceae bacterium]|nr:twin-arginine translocation signal domain-containing protein [Pyrinomonadaceae bacterium]
MSIIIENRRDFLKKAAIAVSTMPLLAGCSGDMLAQKSSDTILDRIKRNADPGRENWTGAKDVPDSVGPKVVLSAETDRGEPIKISGVVYQADGKTPAPETLIYLYHTDFEGYYGRRGDPHRHGRYRGWMLTDKEGRYAFNTIKPAPYPENRWAAHIHMTVTTANLHEDSIDSILFEGDRLINAAERSSAGRKGGFNPILSFVKGDGGLLYATRNIQLPG